jgi:hypothetical protein
MARPESIKITTAVIWARRLFAKHGPVSRHLRAAETAWNAKRLTIARLDIRIHCARKFSWRWMPLA